MTVNNSVFNVLIQKGSYARTVGKDLKHGRHSVDTPSHGFNLIFVSSPFRAANKEVKLYPITIHMAVVIHDHRLGSAAVENGKYLKNSNRTCHDLANGKGYTIKEDLAFSL